MQEQVSVLFSLEPVTVERVQFWMQYGGQASTQNEFDVVSHVYTAFWHEAQAYGNYERVQGWLQQGNVERAIGWADLIMQSLESLLWNWQWAFNIMDSERNEHTWQWYQQVIACRDAVLNLRQLVARQVVQWCTQQHVELPKHTYAFILTQR